MQQPATVDFFVLRCSVYLQTTVTTDSHTETRYRHSRTGWSEDIVHVRVKYSTNSNNNKKKVRLTRIFISLQEW